MTKLKSFLWPGALLLGVGALVLLAQKAPPVDIKPGSYPNCVDRDSKGTVAVGLDQSGYSSLTIKLSNTSLCKDLNAITVSALRCKVADIPYYGDSSDLICHFSTDELRAKGLMPASGQCKTLYVCVGNFASATGSDRLCEAHSSTCN